MRFSIILMIFFLYRTTFIFCRPTQLEEENNSEANEGDYESDEGPDDEYLHEDELTAIDEAPEKQSPQDGIQNSEEQEFIHDPRLSSDSHNDNNKNFGTMAENESNSRRNTPDEYVIDSKFNQNEKYVTEKENINTNAANNAMEIESSQVERGYKRNLDCKNFKEKSSRFASDYSGDLLFQPDNDDSNNVKSNSGINKNQQYNFQKYHDSRNLENKLAKNNDYSYNVERNRRQVQSIYEKQPVTEVNILQNDNNNFDNANENDILKNIKKLSEQDLEELLNSLPEDKKVLLRKIMNKREITKKAGAIEDNSCLDQSDTSKIEGSFSISTSSSMTGSTESSSKNDDNGEEINTKILYGETNTEKSENKSGGSDDTSTFIELTNVGSKDEEKLNNYNKETSKNENKREVSNQDITNESDSLENIYDDFESKHTNDYPVEKELYNNEKLFETSNEALKPQKREISQEINSEILDSEQKLEESFPSVKVYEDAELDMEPLVRVKRTELRHRVKKRDLPYLPSNTVADLEDESDNVESCEFVNKGFLDSQSNYAKKDRYVQINGDSILNKSQILLQDGTNLKIKSNNSPSDQSIITERDKSCLGSDTDCVLSGIEGVDDNIMLNNEIRNRRRLSLDNIIDTNTLNNNANVTQSNVLRNHNDVVIDSVHYPVNLSPYQLEAVFGPSSRDAQEDVGRYKRIKRLRNEKLMA